MKTKNNVKDYLKTSCSKLGARTIENSFSPFFFYEIPVPDALSKKLKTNKIHTK